MNKILVTLLFVFANLGHCFEVREFAPPKSFWPSSPTVTLSYTQPNSSGVIIFLPGGNGQFPVPKHPVEPRGYALVFKHLADMSGFDIVAVNSPYSLNSPGGPTPSLRESNDHLDRLETVVRHYQKTHKVWVMGHSNGTFSAAALVRRLQDKNEIHLISGMILNGARDVTQFTRETDVPTLFIHHVRDGCLWTSHKDAYQNFLQLKKINNRTTEFVSIDSVAEVSGNPCMSGYHYMQGAHAETAAEIHKFISQSK